MKFKLLVFSLCLFSLGAKSQLPPSLIRTDGFYLYDNGITSITISAISQEDKEAIWAIMEKEYNVKDAGNSKKCLPKGEMSLLGVSSYQHIVCFFGDTTGTAFGEVCRDKEAFERISETLALRRKNEDTRGIVPSHAISNFSLSPVGKLSFSIGRDEFFGETFEGHAYGDSLVLQADRKMAATMANPLWQNKRVYKFIPFGKIPPSFTTGVQIIRGDKE